MSRLVLFSFSFSCNILRWCCCTRAPSTGARLSPRLSTLSLPLWLPLATQSTLPPALSDFLFRPSVGLPDSRSRLRPRVSTVLQSAFPAETLSSSSSSRSTPRVAAGFPRTPVLALPLYQEMPRARAGEAERDRSPSSDPSSPTLGNLRERASEEDRGCRGSKT